MRAPGSSSLPIYNLRFTDDLSYEDGGSYNQIANTSMWRFCLSFEDLFTLTAVLLKLSLMEVDCCLGHI